MFLRHPDLFTHHLSWRITRIHENLSIHMMLKESHNDEVNCERMWRIEKIPRSRRFGCYQKWKWCPTKGSARQDPREIEKPKLT
jgi:hypothetical protein